MADDIVTLLVLILLQAVLGLDNLLYISIESKRAPKADRKRVRRIGIILAVALRIGLLFVLLELLKIFTEPLFHIDIDGVISGAFNPYALIVLAGGVFILYTATKEIWHMMHIAEHATHKAEEGSKPTKKVIIAIVIMNLVFSFDSILSAMALTKELWVMATAIAIGGILMIWLSDRVSVFLEKNKMFEVLGLFVLLIVGVMLLSEGAHKAHLHLFGAEVTAMSKATFYFVLAVMVIIDIVQTRYQKQLTKMRQRLTKEAPAPAASEPPPTS